MVFCHIHLYNIYSYSTCSVKQAGVFTFSSSYRAAGCMVAVVVRSSEWLLSGQILRSPAGCVQVLAGLSDVGSSHAEAVLSVLRARREEICHALLDRTNSISSATLQDFDWQLKVTYCFILQCLIDFAPHF